MVSPRYVSFSEKVVRYCYFLLIHPQVSTTFACLCAHALGNNFLTMPSKSSLRKDFTLHRQGLSKEDISLCAQKVHDLLFSRIMMHRFDEIHIFLPIEKQREVDTRLIISTLRKDFAPNIYLPKSYQAGKLTHHVYEPETKLVVNRWGVPEPENVEVSFPASTFDLVFVPLLAFDKRGYRVGYGGGYYDRFLSECRSSCLKVGLSFFEPVDEILDVNEFDIKLNHCITPNKIWTF